MTRLALVVLALSISPVERPTQTAKWTFVGDAESSTAKTCFDRKFDVVIAATFCVNREVTVPNGVFLHGGSFGKGNRLMRVFEIALAGIDDSGILLTVRTSEADADMQRDFTENDQANMSTRLSPQLRRALAIGLGGFGESPREVSFRLPTPPLEWTYEADAYTEIPLVLSLDGTRLRTRLVTSQE